MESRELKDLAWLGDAVLALYARQWLLEEPPNPLFTRQQLFLRFTTNAFLLAAGAPTQVEARIGRIYRENGLEAAFAHIDETLRPLFLKHLANASRGSRGSRKRA